MIILAIVNHHSRAIKSIPYTHVMAHIYGSHLKRIKAISNDAIASRAEWQHRRVTPSYE